MSRSTVRLETRGLQDLRKQLAVAKGSYAKVGLLGDTADRGVVPLGDQVGPLQPDKLNNPTLGLIQEKGSVSHKIPRRSFLETPLKDQLPIRIRAIGVESWRKLVLEKGILVALTFLGVEAEKVVDEGFATGGFGKWVPLHPKTVLRKGSDTILILTSQMRKGVHSAVIKKGSA